MNNNVSNVNNESVTPVIETPPKGNNLFKVLFVISILVVIGLLIVIYSLLQNSKKSDITETNNEVEKTVTPTTEPTIIETVVSQQATPTTEKSKTYKATSVQDDKNSVTKLILKDDQGNETIIDKQSYWKLGETDTIIKPSFSNFVFSPNNNFLSYIKNSGYEGGQSFLYDIKNKQKIDHLGFYTYTDAGFTADSKYFYVCSEHGMDNGGAIIIDLIKSTPVYNKEGSFNCKYNTNDNSLSLTEEISSLTKESLISREKKTTLFSFTKGDFIN